DHIKDTDIEELMFAVFSTIPEICNFVANFLSEDEGTFVLVFRDIYLADLEVVLGAINALSVGLLVLAIGLSLGGPTGYAINPSRDLGPRIMHSLLPIPGKGSSDWSYSWIPVFGPITGGALAALVYYLLPF